MRRRRNRRTYGGFRYARRGTRSSTPGEITISSRRRLRRSKSKSRTKGRRRAENVPKKSRRRRVGGGTGRTGRRK